MVFLCACNSWWHTSPYNFMFEAYLISNRKLHCAVYLIHGVIVISIHGFRLEWYLLGILSLAIKNTDWISFLWAMDRFYFFISTYPKIQSILFIIFSTDRPKIFGKKSVNQNFKKNSLWPKATLHLQCVSFSS